MRSVRFRQFGSPAEVLTLEEVPAPRPGPGEASVRVDARVINVNELYMVRGHYGILPKLPATPGYEGVGRVAEVGEGVTSLKVGQRVTFAPLSTLGTWQEVVAAKADD